MTETRPTRAPRHVGHLTAQPPPSSPSGPDVGSAGRLNLLRFGPAAVVAVALILAAAAGGVSGIAVFLYALRLAVAVLLPGVVISRLVRTGPRTGVEDLVVGFAVGTVFQVPVWWVCLQLGLSYWWWPALVLVVTTLVPVARRRVLRPGLARVPLAWSASVAALCLVTLGWVWGDFLRWSPIAPRTSHFYYGDLQFHLSVAAEAQRALPPTLPQVAGDPLYYHWLSHLDLGLAGQLTGIELSAVLFQLWVPTTVVAGVVALAACGTRLSGRLWAGPLAAALTYAVGEVGLASANVSTFAPMTQFYAWASPSQAIAAVLTVPAAAVVVDFLRGDGNSGRQLLLLGLPLFGGLALAKSAVLPVLIGGVAVLAVLLVLRRSWTNLGRAVTVGVALAGTFGLALVTVYGGQGGGLSLSVLAPLRRYAEAYLLAGTDPTTPAVILAVVVTTLVWSLTVLGRLWPVLLWVPRWSTLEVGQIFVVGALLAGGAAYLLLDHPGGSSVYFLISAFPLGAIGAAWAVCTEVPRLTRRAASMTVALVLLTGALAWLVIPLIGATRPTEGFAARLGFFTRPALYVCVAAAVALLVVALLRRPAPLRARAVIVITAVVAAAGVPTTLEYTFELRPNTGVARSRAERSDSPVAVTAAGVAAARWLRDATDADTVIVTNRHCLDGGRFPGPGPEATRCEVLSFWVSAWTERRVLVEGWAFGHRAVQLEVQNGRTYKRQPFWDQELLAANDGFFASPSRAEAAVLCARGARYAFLDRRFQPSLPTLGPVAEQIYATTDAEVYRLPC